MIFNNIDEDGLSFDVEYYTFQQLDQTISDLNILQRRCKEMTKVF